jgi:cysteine synthase A
MFALEWCEFCWSVRNLFDAVGIPYTLINLDAANFEGGQVFAAEVRKALHHRTFAATIPQIFVNGIHIGGATETFDAFNAGALQTDLCDIGIDVEAGKVDDAYQFLPDWLHSMSD